ncbi:MAG: hypothetical protein Q9211_003441 [Gyalolechia sp. 1 TL-2023]
MGGSTPPSELQVLAQLANGVMKKSRKHVHHHQTQRQSSPPNLFSARQPRKASKDDQDATVAVGSKMSDAALELNPSASRPVDQFRSQIIKEMQWIADEDRSQRSSTDEMEAEAYKTVKHTWKRWKIWSEEWGPIPGPTWPHEHPYVGSETCTRETDVANGSRTNQGRRTWLYHLPDTRPRLYDEASDNTNTENDNKPADTVTHFVFQPYLNGSTDIPPNRLPAIPEVSQQEHLTLESGREISSRPSSQNGGNGIEDQQQKTLEVAVIPKQSLASSKTTKRKRGIEPPPTDAAPEQSAAKRRKASPSENHHSETG